MQVFDSTCYSIRVHIAFTIATCTAAALRLYLGIAVYLLLPLPCFPATLDLLYPPAHTTNRHLLIVLDRVAQEVRCMGCDQLSAQ